MLDMGLYLQNVNVSEIRAGLLDTGDHGLLGLTNPDTGIVVLLVGLVGTIGVADLTLEVGLLALVKVLDALPVSPLGIGINVHLDNTKVDSGLDIVLGRSRSSVEDEPNGLIRLELQLLLNVSLVLSEKLGVELDVTRGIHSVNVSKGSRDGEQIGNLAESVVDIENILGLGVKRSIVDLRVVNTILLTSSDTNLHLEVAVDLGHAVEVFDANLNVLLLAVLREIEHVGREKRFTVLGKVFLISSQHTIEPRKELLGAVIRVNNDGDTVGLGNGANMVGASNGSENGGLLVLVGDTLSSVVSSTTVGELDDNGGLCVTGSLESSIHGAGGSAVDGGDGETMLGGIGKDLADVVTGDDTSGDDIEKTHID